MILQIGKTLPYISHTSIQNLTFSLTNKKAHCCNKPIILCGSQVNESALLNYKISLFKSIVPCYSHGKRQTALSLELIDILWIPG